MLRSGTTSFLEAGTVRYVDAVVDGLLEAGIRGRIGRWVWDLPPEPEVYRQSTDEAIANLEAVLSQHRNHDDGRIQAWSMVVGHTACSDELWRAAAELGRSYDRSEEHTSELQSLMRISYAVFCWKKKTN